jgi:hypothetical protein
MYLQNHFMTIEWKPLLKRALIGAIIGFVLMSLFLLSVKHPNPEWPKLWMIRPLIVIQFAGAAGGVFYYMMDPIRKQGGWKMILANFASLVVFIVGLWMGMVLGLVGTLWH